MVLRCIMKKGLYWVKYKSPAFVNAGVSYPPLNPITIELLEFRGKVEDGKLELWFMGWDIPDHIPESDIIEFVEVKNPWV
jgi:hypothetical protein